jgi:hypothetical protein
LDGITVGGWGCGSRVSVLTDDWKNDDLFDEEDRGLWFQSLFLWALRMGGNGESNSRSPAGMTTRKATATTNTGILHCVQDDGDFGFGMTMVLRSGEDGFCDGEKRQGLRW